MEREYLERLVRILEAIQSLEGSPIDSAESRAALRKLRSLAGAAPAGLKKMRPSIDWDALCAINKGGKAPGDQFLGRVLPEAKTTILDEFNLDSGKLVHAGRTDASFAAIFDTSLSGRAVRCLYMDGVLSSAEHADGSPALLYPPVVMRSFEMLGDPRRGLVIGVAGGTMVGILKRAFLKMHVDAVDVDRGAVALGKKYFSLKGNGRTSIHIADGREFVQAAKAKYGIIVIDAFCGISPVPGMATVEFVSEAKAALDSGGACAINIIAKVERDGYLQYAYDTWRSVFRNVFVLPLCSEGGVFNVVLIATDADPKGFERQNADALYRMDFDRSRIFTDKDNKIRELSPY